MQTGELVKTFTFADFKAALKFVNRVGKLAEQAGHHPDIFLHNYKNVKLSLQTHERKAVTHKDFALAKQINSLIRVRT